MNSTLEKCSKASAVRENPCLKSVLTQLNEQRHETGDIKFIVGSKEIPAHRNILAALSPKYKAQFYGSMPENDVVNLSGVSAIAFEEFLQFFYTNEVTLTLENIEDVFNLAKQSLVDELITECTGFLRDVIGMDKLIWCYRLAKDYEIASLEEFCVKEIGGNIKAVFQSQDFLSCEQEMLGHILALDSMNCNENDVFVACISWAEAKCKQDGIEVASTANLRAALGNVIFKIRFCSMSAEQFAVIDDKNSGLLSPRESNEVYRTIVLKRINSESSIFDGKNNRPREPIRSSLECSFSTGSPMHMHVTKPVKSDILKFHCDTDILLNGFVVCNRIVDDIDIVVKITGVPQSFQYTKVVSEFDDKTEIRFSNPFHLKENQWCYIKISSDTFQQKSIEWYGFSVKKSTIQNGVTFECAEYHCNEINFITGVLFDVIDVNSQNNTK